jgi:hypothetical protein
MRSPFLEMDAKEKELLSHEIFTKKEKVTTEQLFTRLSRHSPEFSHYHAKCCEGIVN